MRFSALSLRAQLRVGIAAVLIIFLGMGSIIYYAIQQGELDTLKTDIQGANRMLSQRMAKAAIAAALSKNTLKATENRVAGQNDYTTQMRTIFTQHVVEPLQGSDVALSMAPQQQSHTAIPFPATFTRFVNERYSANNNEVTVDILAETPINPAKGLKTNSDRKAWQFLQEQPQSLYYEPQETERGLDMVFYTADIATAEGCVSCHTARQGTPFKQGDVLGIRKFRLHYSNDVALGMAELNPSMDEYEQAKSAFANALALMREGGELENGIYIEPIADPEYRTKAAEVAATFEQFTRTVEVMLSEEAGTDAFRQAQQGVLSGSNQLLAQSKELVAIYTNKLAVQHQRFLFGALIAAAVLILLIFGLVMWLLSNTVARPLEQVVTLFGRVADGDLSVHLPARGANREMHQFAMYFNHMIDTLNQLISQVLTASRQLTSASNQMADVTARTTAGVEQQQMGTDRMAAAINEMADSVQEVSRNAQHAAAATAEADSEASQGQALVENTVTAITQLAQEVEQSAAKVQTLQHKSSSIGSVVDSIGEISEQTNLLALNAAIEAARAGEQGRGFAVVADEVRVLASRTQTSTQEIQDIIQQLLTETEAAATVMQAGVSQAQATVEQASQAGRALRTITTTVAAINDMNQQIAAAAEEQSTVSEEINQNVVEISAIAEDTTASAGQTDSASRELLTLAEDLQQTISHFKVK